MWPLSLEKAIKHRLRETQILELVYKDFKVAFQNMFKDLKEVMDRMNK